MEELESEYQKTIRFIDEVEAGALKGAVDFVNILPSMGAAQNPQPRSYAELADFIEGIDPAKRFGSNIKEQATAPQAPTQDTSHLISGLSQAKSTQMQSQVQQQRPPTLPPLLPPKLPLENQKKKDNIIKELSDLTQRIQGGMPKLGEITRKKVDVKDLVLPSLSMADQIAELERIVEGLKEGVFDKEHFEIVKQEVYGLNQIVEHMKKGKTNKRIHLSSLERSLLDLREQRINDAMALIKNASNIKGKGANQWL